MEQYYYSPFIDESTKIQRSQLHKPITLFFEQLKQVKKGKDLPVDVLYALTHGPIISLTKFCLEGDLVLDEATIEKTIEASWVGITV